VGVFVHWVHRSPAVNAAHLHLSAAASFPPIAAQTHAIKTRTGNKNLICKLHSQSIIWLLYLSVNQHQQME
jgi:hypothetical protein